MAITFDIHTHTVRSDGKSTAEENIQNATKRLQTLGISDHGPGHPWYGIRKKGLEQQRIEIDELRGDFPVLQGIEANIMSEDGKNDLAGLPPLDYVLIGHHRGIFPRSLFSVHLSLLARRNPEAARKCITDASIAAMDDTRIDAITHPGAYVPVDMPRLAAAAAEKGVLIEINTRHPLPVEDAKAAYAAGATFLLSSDAHLAERVGVVDASELCAKEAGIPDEAIINSPGYRWDRGVRLERLKDVFLRA